MKIAPLYYPRLTIVALIVMVACGIWVPRQLRLGQTRRRLDDTRKQLIATESRTTTARHALETSRRELKSENSRRARVALDLANAGQALAKADPETRWATPPATLPEWNAESPYVWLRKEMVPRFSIPAFTEDGELHPEIANVLMVDPTTLRALNEKLKQYLADYRALEVAGAERSDEHLPGIAGQTGDKLTIRVQPLPDEGARIKQQFEADLAQTLGDQRATLVKQVSEYWLASNFAQFGAEPRIISVLRRPGGNFNLSIKTGGNWISTGGPVDNVMRQIPPHLRPLFATFLQPSVAKDGQ